MTLLLIPNSVILSVIAVRGRPDRLPHQQQEMAGGRRRRDVRQLLLDRGHVDREGEDAEWRRRRERLGGRGVTIPALDPDHESDFQVFWN